MPRRAPLPAAKRELLITVDVGEQRVALLEDDRVAEVYLERPERRSIAGNIYLGTVDNVLPGMEAAFVEIGLEKNGFLYVDEIIVPELEGTRHGKKITDLIQRGQEILVQAVKDPMKTKGARLTTEISLPGRFLVYVPNGEGLGVSRRLEDTERQRLKEILKNIAPSTGGVIVRTAAEGASAEDVERDLVFLQRLWKTIQARAKTAKAPELVYQEAELPLRIVRDLFAGDFVAAYVDSDRTHKRIVGYLKKTSPHMVERVHRTKEKEPLFERYGVEKEIASTIDRRVDLPSGGYLIFDYAEAFTVIDVNTGRFVGSRSKTSTQRLEDTAVKNNLEAVKEVVRQLRLRDIGGIIVIDFIDMANPKNRHAVEETLRTELERDRTKTFVVEISPLGLVEMTRQNVTDGPREVMTRRCPTCAGDGIVVSDATVALEVERKLRTLAAGGAGSRIQAYKVAVHPKTLSLLAGAGGARLAALEEATRRRFYLVAATGHAHVDHFEVLAEGRRDDLAADGVGRGGRRARGEARRDRPPRRDGRGRQARRPGRRRRGRGEARRQEGEGARRSRARRPGVRDARERSVRSRADHLRERGGEADPRTGAEEGRRAAGEAVAAPELDEADEPDETDARSCEVDEADGRDRDRDGRRSRRRRASARAADRAAASGARSRPRGRWTRPSPRPTTRSTDVVEAEAAVVEVAADDAESAPPASRPPRRRAPRIHVPDGTPGETLGVRGRGRGRCGDRRAAGRSGRRRRRAHRGVGRRRPERRRAAEEAHPSRDARRPESQAQARGPERRRHRHDADADAMCAAAEIEAAVESAETPEAPADDGPAEALQPGEAEEYVPMSEWIGDFDRRTVTDVGQTGLRYNPAVRGPPPASFHVRRPEP